MKKYRYAIFWLNRRLKKLEKRYNKYLEYEERYYALESITKERAELTQAIEALKMFSK